jgi:hypothetical protein
MSGCKKRKITLQFGVKYDERNTINYLN